MSPTASILAWSGNRCEPLKRARDSGMDNVKLADGTYLAGTLLGEVLGVKEQQTLNTTGTVSGGTFTLSYGGQTTPALAYDASAATVRDALNALSTIGDGGVVVTGTLAGDNMVVEFQTPGNKTNLTADSTLITGGGTIGVVTTTRAGTSVTSTYKAYDQDATDGSQVPTGHVLEYPYVVSSGKYYIGDTASAEYLQYTTYAHAWRNGIFDCADLVGLDANAVSVLNARLVEGDLDTGRIVIPG
jgi:hypothetical protein